MIILNSTEIELKVNRLAVQIMEENTDVDELILLGINTRGYKLAEYIYNKINERNSNYAKLGRLRINPANPLEKDVELDIDLQSFKNKNVIVLDDVANTGRTLFYAMQPLMKVLPRKIEAGVLVDRRHKSFPIYVNYVGLSLSTTIQQHIEVTIENREVFVELF